ncbi:hypothetical protein HYFRA_00005065 [Hymenoscyphus fraxineus]|uniref:glycogenin glucosyltransferase n=1 Tax=Hymenoscyphus fraxineus TaxID=746836 RepID=A0A9N9KLY6_9HELO|nr:hypothetical protein HYFRA_00005065 [Hymenoscyphus fraxineus]
MASASEGEDVYATLLLSDPYLPGALVVAHSLRDAGTTKKLAVLITADTVSQSAINQLQRVYDYIIPVERVVTPTPANLFLMNRADLHSTFTKINLWKLLQFRKIVYVDADMVAIRAPDELFDLPQPFSAAPDIGWPDIFNTGLMVLTPNMGDYHSLLAMAERGISFDGADQGLLNMHFKNTFNRLSFTYNVTPSAHYQYLPAYRHFQSSISMGHFIGKDKPWTLGRDAHNGSNPYDEMVGRWWATYDRHFRESSVEGSAQGRSTLVHYLTKGEFHPTTAGNTFTDDQAFHSEKPHPKEFHVASHAAHPQESSRTEGEQTSTIAYTASGEDLHGVSVPHETPLHGTAEIPKELEEAYVPPVQTNLDREREREIQYQPTWDASIAPPPSDSRPEASNFPSTHYEMSSDPTPFQAPPRYPDPPRDMYYEVPKTPTYQKPAPIFPWEKNASKPTRVFYEDHPEITEPFSSTVEFAPEPPVSSARQEVVTPVTPITSTTPIIQLTPTDPWQTYSRGNAWDDIPEIERYIGHLQKNRKGNIQVLQGSGVGVEEQASRRHSMRLTDFPTEFERPSLPVTPAPIRRSQFWGEERNSRGELPAAEGVPSQEEWDPATRLEQLARQQSDVLAHKLGEIPAKELPTRSLPYGSEGVISPGYVAKGPSTSVEADATDSTPRTHIEEPSFQGPGAQFEKGETFLSKLTPEPATEEEMDVLET